MSPYRDTMFQKSLVISKLCALSLVLMLCLPVYAQSRWVGIDQRTRKDVVKPALAASDSQSTDITLEIPGVTITRVEAQGQIYDVVEVPGCGKDARQVGLPELPIKSFFVEIPYGVKVNAEILYADETSLGTGYRIYPRQPDEPDSYVEGIDRSFKIDTQLYSSNSFYPTQLVEIDEPGFMRGRRIVNVRVYPVKFNPVTTELVVVKNFGIRLSYSGQARDASARKARLKSRSFEALSSQILVNYEPTEDVEVKADDESDGLSTTNSADYLIIVDDPLYDEILPLAEWKNKKGYKTRVVLMSDVGTTTSDLMSYIQNAYNTWSPAPTYVLFAGDDPDIPADYYSGTYPCYTDYYYSCVDGGDEYPDLYLGRLPFSSGTDMTNAVNKILTYERTPVTGVFYDDILCAGYFQDDGDDGNAGDNDCIADRWFMETTASVYKWMNDNTDWEEYSALCTTYWPRTCTTTNYHFRPNTYTHRAEINDEIWGCAPAEYPDPVPSWVPSLWTSAADATADISAAINTGVSLVLHRDHGATSGWSHPPFGTTSVGALTNANRLPVVLSVNCLTGSFQSTGTTFCDSFLSKSSGGCVGILGATRVSYSGKNDLLIHGMFDSMFPSYDSTYGDTTYPSSFRPTEFINYGKYYMRSFYPVSDSAETTLYMFHWFGDPEMQLRTSSPVSLTVSHPEYRWKDSLGSFYVTVTYGATAVQGALVCISHPDTQEQWTAVTNASGYAYVSNVKFTASSPYDIVVSSRNYYPYEGTIISREQDYFTELFSASDNDLSYMTIVFTPDGSRSYYKTCEDYAGVFPIGIDGAAQLPLSADDWELVTLAGGKQVMLYGQKYSSFYVSSKGYITFNAGDYDWSESLADHFDLPRVSALYDDLNPTLGDGGVYFQQLADRAVVTYDKVSEYGLATPNSNSFQIQMLFDGTIIITWLERDAVDGLAGLSDGYGVPADFIETNLSSNTSCCTPRPTRPINPSPDVGANSITTKTTLKWAEKSVVINEIDVGAVDALELYNPTPEMIDLTGWQVVCIRTTATTVLTIPEFVLNPYTYVVLSEAAGTNTSTELYFSQNIYWLNYTSGSCALIDADGVGIDFVRWTSEDRTDISTEVPPAGTGWGGTDPNAPGNDSAHSIGRDMRGNDRDLGEDWENTSGVNAESKTFGSWNYSTAAAAGMDDTLSEDSDGANADGQNVGVIPADMSRPADVLAAIASLNARAVRSGEPGLPADGITVEEADGSGDAASVLFISGGDPAVYQPDVAILAAASSSTSDARFTDPQAKLLATGKFNSVSIINAYLVTPTLSELKAFDAVIVWSNTIFANPTLLGDVLADYVDDGGGVVVAVFATTNSGSLMLQGRFLAEDYYCIEPGNGSSSSSSTMGTNNPLHPLMDGVISFSGGSSSYRPASTSVLGGSTVVAQWADGRPLVVERSVNGRRRVDLGMYPPSNVALTNSWDSTTDGDLIMANALMYVARATNPKTQYCYTFGGATSTYTNTNMLRGNVYSFNTYQILSGIGMDLSYDGDKYILTDEFDYGEDQSSHSYMESGSVYTGAYDCDGDGALRIGSNDIGSWAQITVRVSPGVNRIKLRYQVPWAGSPGAVLYVDGVNKGNLFGNNCDWQELVLTGMSSYTADGELVIRLVDESAAFSGDTQITRLEVYSAGATVDLYYYVLESSSLEGTYTPIFERIVSTGISGSEHHSSGPLSVTLRPYRYYAIGVAWDGDSLRYSRKSETLPRDWELGEVERAMWLNSITLPLSATTLGLDATYEYSMSLCFSADYVPEVIYAAAGGPAYYFGTIDPDTGAFASIGTAVGEIVDGMAYDENHDIVYATLFSDLSLISINQSTGAVTSIGLTGTSYSIRGLAYDSNRDILYGVAQSSKTLYTINTYTGQATLVGTYSGELIAGLAFDPETDTLYGVEDRTSLDSRLVSLDTSTAAMTAIGVLGTGITDVDSLAYSRLTKRLYAVFDDTGELLEISPITGKATVVGNTGVTWSDTGHGLTIKPDYSYTTRYDVYLGTSNPPQDRLAKNLFVTEAPTAELDKFESYYWQVVGKTPCGCRISDVWSFNTCPPGDFDDDCDVDFADFSVFAAAWLTEEPDPDYNAVCDIAIPLDDRVDFHDLREMVENWCEGK